LRKFLKEDFKSIDEQIKSNLPIKDIIENIRRKGYSFDNSRVSRYIGAYRTNILASIVNEISPKENEIMLDGYIRKDKNTLSINFHLSHLSQILKEKQIRVKLEIAKNKKIIRLVNSDFGRKLIRANQVIKILITGKSGLEVGSKIKIIFNPVDFGFNVFESIYDPDSRDLAKEAIKRKFKLDVQRSTPNNHKGDLSLFYKGKHILIEITQARSYKSSYFKIGQCFIQKINWPESTQFIICKRELLSNSSLRAFRKMNVNTIQTYFNKGWEKEVIKKIINTIE
jgi:hypothetical protein